MYAAAGGSTALNRAQKGMIPVANVLLFSNAPFCKSGYGTQANQLVRSLTALGHECAVAAFHGLQGIPLRHEGILIYPGSGEDPWALDVLPGHYRHFKADLLITLMDAWVLDPGVLRGMNVAHWMPIDCAPVSVLDRRVLDGGGARPIAMARHGEQMLRDAGFDPLYAPHALDTGLWQPPPDRDAVRREMGLDGRFVVGINAANQDPFRKGLAEQITAFARFAARHDDAVLLLHTRRQTRQGIDVDALISSLGIAGRVRGHDQYLIASGMIPDGPMVNWHAACDVVSNTAFGEGFGLAILQAQATGTPVVVTDCSSMSELCGAGWKVTGEPFYNKAHQAWWTHPSAAQIEKAYEKAYAGAARLRKKAREFALAYDSMRVAKECWAPIITELTS